MEKILNVIAIDPGSEKSAFIHLSRYYPPYDKIIIRGKGIHENHYFKQNVLNCLGDSATMLVVEEIQSYGMPVGKSVFATCIWCGRFVETWHGPYVFIPRREVKLHFCGSMRAKDSNVRQALIDRFGKPGTKKHPGFTYGISKDLWQALALGVYYLDTTQ